MNKNDALELEDIQDEIVSIEAEPNHEALLRWCRQYPQHKEALSQFFVTWATQIAKLERPVVDEARIGSRMVSHALNLIYKSTPAEESAKQVVPELRLFKMIKAAGVTEEAVMKQCGLDESLLAKLDRRLIRLASVPTVCFERLSEAIHVAVNDILHALTGGPIPLSSYKAKGKPSLSQESFLEAVTSSDLTDEVKKDWERLISSDKAIGG